MKTIAISNQKGGVGKTTVTLNLSAALVQAGKRVLVVDLDPQHTLTVIFDPLKHARRTVAAVLRKPDLARDSIITGDRRSLRADILPADGSLADVEIDLMRRDGVPDTLKKAIRTLQNDYDYVLIDSAPGLGKLSIMALKAADLAVVPTEADALSPIGVRNFFDVAGVVRRDLPVKLLVAKYSTRTILAAEVLDVLREGYGDKMFATVIRQRVQISESPLHGCSVLAYRDKSHGAADYTALARELMEG